MFFWGEVCLGVKQNKMKKIGVFVDHYSFRADVRDLINLLLSDDRVVIYADKNDLTEYSFPVRRLGRVKSFKNKILDFLFGLIVTSAVKKEDSINWKFRRLNNNFNFRTLLKVIYIYITVYFPKFVSADFLLQFYDKNECDLSDVQSILLFSDVKYPCLLSRLAKENIFTCVYIYSWDHPSKLSYVPRQRVQYLVWNESLMEDMYALHYVAKENISVVGSTQLSYLYDYFEEKNTSYNKGKYIYFAAAWGRSEMAKQEISFLNALSEVVLASYPDCYILFRPYPNIEDPKVYELVDSMPNVEVDHYTSDSKYIFNKENIKDKLIKIDSAAAVFHTGSTFGLEVAYFDTPCIFFIFKDKEYVEQSRFHMRCSNAVAQHHLNKYLVFEEFRNTVKHKDELKGLVEAIFTYDPSLKQYNNKISQFTKLKSLNAVADGIAKSLIKGGA